MEVLPDKTLVVCREKTAPGFKKSKDRLTVLVCTNATGTHKLKRASCHTSLNSEIFAEWFKKDFVPAVKHHQHTQNICSPKALLLMDNCSAHPEELKSSDGSTTSLIQPMDQGVLQAAKNRYKRKLLQRVITNQDAETTQSLKEIKKKLTVKESIYMLADAWEEASAESIFKAFSKLQIHPNAETRLNNSEMQMESIVSESMMEIVNEVGNS